MIFEGQQLDHASTQGRACRNVKQDLQENIVNDAGRMDGTDPVSLDLFGTKHCCLD